MPLTCPALIAVVGQVDKASGGYKQLGDEEGGGTKKGAVQLPEETPWAWMSEEGELACWKPCMAADISW